MVLIDITKAGSVKSVGRIGTVPTRRLPLASKNQRILDNDRLWWMGEGWRACQSIDCVRTFPRGLIFAGTAWDIRDILRCSQPKTVEAQADPDSGDVA
jgi:hypothetical protein